MRLISTQEDVAVVVLTDLSLLVISNAIDDVCHALDKREVHSRTGVSIECMLNLHCEIRDLLDRIQTAVIGGTDRGMVHDADASPEAMRGTADFNASAAHMKVLSIEKNTASVLLSENAILAICNAFNEVCNGLPQHRFVERIGTTREDAKELHRQALTIYKELRKEKR